MEEKALSDIVAVILLVGMTAVMALIAWGFLSKVHQPPKMYIVGISISDNHGRNITLTYLGGRDSNKVLRLIVKGINSTGAQMRFYSPANSTHNKPQKAIPDLVLEHPKIGNAIYTTDGTKKNDHIIVIAEFEDGSKYVIFDEVV